MNVEDAFRYTTYLQTDAIMFFKGRSYSERPLRCERKLVASHIGQSFFLLHDAAGLLLLRTVLHTCRKRLHDDSV